MKIERVFGDGLRESLRLLEESLRDGEPLPEEFVSRMKSSADAGDIEVLAASENGRAVGVLVLAFRVNVSLGGLFASVEDLHVESEERRRGVGGKLLEAVEARCRRRGVSYVEVQAEEDGAMAFYSKLGYEVEEEVRVFSRSYTL